MRSTYLFLFFLLFNGLNPTFCQTVDSTWVIIWDSLTIQKDSLHLKRQYQQALPIAKELIAVAEKGFGVNSIEYGSALGNYGDFLRGLRRPEQALPYFLQSIDVFEKIGKTQESALGSIYNNFSLTLTDLGQFERAIQVLELATAITVDKFGKEHPYYANRLNNLAITHAKMENFEKALPLVLEATKITKATQGEQHPNYTDRLNNLAIVYAKLGQHEKSTPLYRETLNITAKVLGKNTPTYATRLQNIGIYYYDLHQYELALELTHQALSITSEILGKDHFYYGARCRNLAYIHKALEQPDSAIYYGKIAQENIAKTLGEKHPIYASICGALGYAYHDLADYDQAIYFLKLAIENRIANFGEDHYNLGNYLIQKAYSHLMLGEKSAAQNLMISCSENLMNNINQRFNALTDQQQVALLRDAQYRLDGIQSFALNHPDATPIIEASLNQQILLKGLVLNYKNNLLESLRSQEDKALQATYLEWEQVRNSLARQYSKYVGRRIQSLDSLQNIADELEVQLINNSGEFVQLYSQVDWKTIQSKLEPGEIAIDFSRFNLNTTGEAQQGNVVYVAYLLSPQLEYPLMVNLFKEQDLLNTLGEANPDFSQKLSDLYATRGVVPRASKKTSSNLQNLIWEPLSPYLKEVNTIYFSPVGLLHKINLGVIPISEKQIMMDQFKLVQLMNIRELAFERTTFELSNNFKCFLAGGIQYDLDSTQIDSPTEPIDSNELALQGEEAIRGENPRSLWQFLEGTAEEVNAIQKLLIEKGLQVNAYQGNLATEELFFQKAPQSQLIHIATHGFFLSHDDLIKNEFEPTGMDLLNPIRSTEHPMIRSGLILASANNAWSGKNAPGRKEDGILTAYEISQLDLSKTELVVLSACDTGLGAIEGNEGVYGLQRAFKMAGVKYIMMSLWPIPDLETQELMTLFYKNWIKGDAIRAALWNAQQQMRQKYPNPYYWAGFILVE